MGDIITKIILRDIDRQLTVPTPAVVKTLNNHLVTIAIITELNTFRFKNYQRSYLYKKPFAAFATEDTTYWEERQSLENAVRKSPKEIKGVKKQYNCFLSWLEKINIYFHSITNIILLAVYTSTQSRLRKSWLW